MRTEGPSTVQHHRLLLESRENAHLWAFVKRYGEEAEEIIRKSYYEHGLMSGRRALSKYQPAGCGVRNAVDLLHSWVALGLSHVEQVEWIESSDKRVVVRSAGCIHLASWKVAGIPLDRGCDLYKAWVDGFVHAVNPLIRHYKNSRVAAGDAYCEEVWELAEDPTTLSGDHPGEKND